MSFFDEHTEDKDERSTARDRGDTEPSVEIWIVTHEFECATIPYQSIVADVVVDGMVVPISSTKIDDHVVCEPRPLTYEERYVLSERREALEDGRDPEIDLESIADDYGAPRDHDRDRSRKNIDPATARRLEDRISDTLNASGHDHDTNIDAGCVDVSDFSLEIDDEDFYDHDAIEVINQIDPGDSERVIFRHPAPDHEDEWISADRSSVTYFNRRV